MKIPTKKGEHLYRVVPQTRGNCLTAIQRPVDQSVSKCKPAYIFGISVGVSNIPCSHLSDS